MIADQMHNDNSVLVKVRGLKFARGKRMIFDGVDLDIQRGKITAIMGLHHRRHAEPPRP